MPPQSNDATAMNVQVQKLEELVGANPDDSSLHFQLGFLLWEISGDESLEMKERASKHFVVSARLDPLNAEPFKYLGHYYSKFAIDHQRSIKCYQRAVSLCPEDSDSGEALCDLLDHSGKESLQIALCNDASEKSPRAFWAFKRLGFLHLHREDYSQAVHCLQQAIRGYPACPQLWEALGLSYHRLGMFTASTKSYGRAIELDDTCFLALVESGNIFVMLGSFGKAVENFRLAQKIAPQSLSVSYGLASALLCWSKECLNLGAFKWGASLLEEACQIWDALSCMTGNLFSLWKLHGDIKLTYAKCYPWAEEEQNSVFDSEKFRSSVLSWRQCCYSAASLARTSYQRALHLAPWQANLYIDVSVTSDFLLSFNDIYEHEVTPWQLPEKMAFGALLLEGCNNEFWVTLGCIANHSSLKQHALIRGLQLNLSLGIAWACMALLYRKEGELKLARKAFDCARSMDPSLALPWAGIAADINTIDKKYDEAFEICLRAVQMLPLAEFQIGLAKLAFLSGKISSSEVFVAIQQAILRSPHYPEAHNLQGLIWESRGNYMAAMTSYQRAHCAIKSSFGASSRLSIQDITNNLARCLFLAGHVAAAVQECQNLKTAGLLDERGVQIYALSLWQLGQNNLALSVVEDLMTAVASKEEIGAASVTLICRLIYYISGIDSSVDLILKMPKRWLKTWKLAEVIFAIHTLDESGQLGSTASSIYINNSSHDERVGLHYLMAVAELFKFGSRSCMGFKQGIRHLRKALHIYPESGLLRNLLGYLLLSNGEWGDNHLASKCCMIDVLDSSCKSSLKNGQEIMGAASLSCHAVGIKSPRLSFPTCDCQCLIAPGSVVNLQRYLRQRPWNLDLKYLLLFNVMQRAREERFPKKFLDVLELLLSVALSNDVYILEDVSLRYQKFQLFLCAAEIHLQRGKLVECTMYAKEAKSLVVPEKYLFFCHLFLIRLYAAQDDYINLQKEFLGCLSLKTSYPIGWISLKVLELKYQLPCSLDIKELMFDECSHESTKSRNMWISVFNLVVGLESLKRRDVLSAEESFSQACSLATVDPCHYLLHGTSCMELAKRLRHTQYLMSAVRSLGMAQANSSVPLPIVSLLLAQAEGSMGSKTKWEKTLRQEWYSWPPEMRPAELFCQMHLLANESKNEDPSGGVEFCQTPTKWILRAIHTNPSCNRYWNVLHQIT